LHNAHADLTHFGGFLVEKAHLKTFLSEEDQSSAKIRGIPMQFKEVNQRKFRVLDKNNKAVCPKVAVVYY